MGGSMPSDGFVLHDMETRFHEELLGHSSNIKVITSTILESAILVSLMEEIYEVRRSEAFMW
jgi:hypothetical protein